MSASKLKLNYFNSRGRAELIRLVFIASNTEFEDNRISHEQWPELQKKTPTGAMPYLESASEKCVLVQSGAIARYYAKKTGLMGANDWEFYLVERAMGQIDDVFQEVTKIFFSPEDKQAEMTKEFQANKGQHVLGNLSKFLKEGGSGFYVGKSITLADLASITTLEYLAGMPDLLAKFPEFAEHRNRVLAANAKVADWIKSRPVTQF